MGKRALLVVDIDTANNWIHDIKNLDHDRKIVASEICKTLKEWRDKGELIIFICCVDFLSETTFQLNKCPRCLGCDASDKRSKLASFLEHKHGENFEPVFLKTRNDAFSNKELSIFLREKDVSEVVLAGCFTGLCVQDTAVGALEKGFSVTLLKDCSYWRFGSDYYDIWKSSVLRDSKYPKNVSVSVE